MKRATRSLPLAVLAATASAQTNTVVGNNPNLEGTTTITYSICPTAATITSTLSSTITLCPGPQCNGGMPEITLAPGQGGVVEGGYTTIGPNGESTVYETIYPQTCSTGGMVDVTYMITEACPCTADRPTDYLPSGFSTTVATVLTKTCDTCAETEIPITLTTPCSDGAYATAGVTNTGGSPAGGAAGSAATGAAAGGAPAGGAAAGGSGGAATGPAATGGAAPAASGAAGGNSGAGAGSPGAGQSNAAAGGAPAGGAPAGGAPAGGAPAASAGGAAGNNTTPISPPITPVGGNVASDVGQNPSTFTGAAQKVDIVGFTASAAFSVFVGAAAWWL